MSIPISAMDSATFSLQKCRLGEDELHYKFLSIKSMSIPISAMDSATFTLQKRHLGEDQFNYKFLSIKSMSIPILQQYYKMSENKSIA